MKRSLSIAIAAILAAASWSVCGQSVLRTEFGKNEYRANCAVCHGGSGKGDGMYAEQLKSRIPDLTVLARNNGGVFPFDKVVQTIDGRAIPKAHGTVDMPIWGQAYAIKGMQAMHGEAFNREAYVQARLLALTEYVYTLQGR